MQHIVALSGGKDSTAMALWLNENEPRDYQYVWQRNLLRLGSHLLRSIV